MCRPWLFYFQMGKPGSLFMSFTFKESKIRAPLSIHLSHCVLEKLAQFLIQQPLQSVIDSFPQHPAADEGTQSLNLLLSASHLDHKNSCSEHANQYPPILRTAAKDSQRWLFTKSRAERAQCYLIELPVAKLWAGAHNGRRLMTVQALTPCPRPFPEPHFRAAAAISQLLATDSLCHD